MKQQAQTANSGKVLRDSVCTCQEAKQGVQNALLVRVLLSLLRISVTQKETASQKTRSNLPSPPGDPKFPRNPTTGAVLHNLIKILPVCGVWWPGGGGDFGGASLG